jgi:hypothetical protein
MQMTNASTNGEGPDLSGGDDGAGATGAWRFEEWSDSASAEAYGGLRQDGNAFGAGCGSASNDILVPDHLAGVNLLPACVAHDQCYDAGTATPRKTCDEVFGEQVRTACADAGYPALACALLGATYESGVRVFGAGAYDTPLPAPEETSRHPLDTYLYY